MFVVRSCLCISSNRPVYYSLSGGNEGKKKGNSIGRALRKEHGVCGWMDVK